MKHPILIAPSLLSADFAFLQRDVERCAVAGAEVLHVDVMDGHFVPNITIGPLVVKALRPYTSLIIDCHLMISNADAYIDAFVEAGANWISVHVEACSHLHRTLSRIRDLGCRAGIVLNPATPLEFAYAAAQHCDFILLMSVNPGFGGQQFIPSFLNRCHALRAWLDNHGCASVEIEVDGGLRADNTADIVRAGANILVSGSGIFGGDLQHNVTSIRAAAQGARSMHV